MATLFTKGISSKFAHYRSNAILKKQTNKTALFASSANAYFATNKLQRKMHSKQVHQLLHTIATHLDFHSSQYANSMFVIVDFSTKVIRSIYANIIRSFRIIKQKKLCIMQNVFQLYCEFFCQFGTNPGLREQRLFQRVQGGTQTPSPPKLIILIPFGFFVLKRKCRISSNYPPLLSPPS